MSIKNPLIILKICKDLAIKQSFFKVIPVIQQHLGGCCGTKKAAVISSGTGNNGGRPYSVDAVAGRRRRQQAGSCGGRSLTGRPRPQAVVVRHAEQPPLRSRRGQTEEISFAFFFYYVSDAPIYVP